MDRKTAVFLVLVLIVSFVPLVKYFYSYTNTPEGHYFMSPGRAHMLNMDVVTSGRLGYVNPWNAEKDESIFSTSGVGSTWILVILGVLIDSWVSFFFIMGAFIAISGIMLYIFAGRNRVGMYSTLVYMLSAGLGGLILLMISLFNPGILNAGIQAGFGFSGFKNDESLYYALSPFLGILSLYLLSKKKFLLASIFLGLCIFSYPNYGFMFFLGHILYILVFGIEKRKAVKFLPIVAVLASPWLFTFATGYNYIKTYRMSISTGIGEFLPTLLFAMAFLLFFSFYYFKDNLKIKRKKLLMFLLLATFIISTIGQMSIYGDAELGKISEKLNLNFSFSRQESVALQSTFIVSLSILLYFLLKENRNFFRNNIEGFLLLWAFLGILISMFPQDISPWIAGRTIGVSTIPLSILAANGVIKFSQNFRIKSVYVMLAVILLSLPTVAIYNYYSVNPKINTDLYIEKSSFDSLVPLKGMESGVVFIDVERSDLIPFYFGKKSVLSGNGYVVNDYWEKVGNYRNFSSFDDKKKAELLKKYNVKYLVIGNKIEVIE